MMQRLDGEYYERLTCGECGITFYAPQHWVKVRRHPGALNGKFVCPNGHHRIWQESEFDRVRREHVPWLLAQLALANARADAWLQEIKALRIERATAEAREAVMRTQLKIAANWMEEELKELGGCDHSVGICCCADYSKLEAIRAALDAEGNGMP